MDKRSGSCDSFLQCKHTKEYCGSLKMTGTYVTEEVQCRSAILTRSIDPCFFIILWSRDLKKMENITLSYLIDLRNE